MSATMDAARLLLRLRAQTFGRDHIDATLQAQQVNAFAAVELLNAMGTVHALEFEADRLVARDGCLYSEALAIVSAPTSTHETSTKQALCNNRQESL